jgi:membrane-associated phospholipid phosphatase
MQPLIDISIAVIIAIQGMGEWLNAPMQFFSTLGTENFFFIVLPLIYWCINAALGLRVGFILTIGSVFNHAAKILFAGPRPYWVSSHIKGLWPETGFGVPSNHAQTGMSVWGIIGVHVHEKWFRVVIGILIFLIGFSRIYLGAHFPHDVLLGWLFGGLILYAFVKLEKPVLDWFLQKTFSQQIVASFLISLVFILIGFSAVALRRDFQLSEQWITNALLVSTDPLAPLDRQGIFTLAGTFFGLAAGSVWILRQGGYQPSGPVWKRALCYIIGLIGVLILWRGLGTVLPSGDAFVFYVLRYLRYSLVGVWVAAGAPWVFMRLNLSEKTKLPI